VERHEVRDARLAGERDRGHAGHPVVRVHQVEAVERAEIGAELVDVLIDLALGQRRLGAGGDVVDDESVVEGLGVGLVRRGATREELDMGARPLKGLRERPDEDVHPAGIGGAGPLRG